jgi:hypothetical protein
VFDLLEHEGLCLGGSSGVNVAGAIRLARHLGPGHTVVTILCDSGTRYQSRLFNPDFLRSKGLPVPPGWSAVPESIPALRDRHRFAAFGADAKRADRGYGDRVVLDGAFMRFALAGVVAGVVLGAAAPALAHPHVWITARAEVAYAANGQVTGIRHAWTFDEAYSAFVTQGLDKNGDGKLAPDELAELAKVNTESLASSTISPCSRPMESSRPSGDPPNRP